MPPRPGDAASAPTRERDLSRPLPAALSWIVLAVFAGAFAVAYVLLALPLWMPVLYAVLSVIAFAAYGLDKRAARRGGQRGGQRTSEQTLLIFGLLGGWPGALVAQQLFRHKTRKRSFRSAFWLTVVVNVLALAGLVTVATINGWDLSLPSPLGILSAG